MSTTFIDGEFTGHFSGSVSSPGQPGYQDAITGYDLAIRQAPVVVITAADAKDVQTAVRMARSRALPVGVQATGHGITVPADGAVLINTSRLQRVEIDPERRTARIQAGATWDKVITAAAPYGLAPLVGASPAVGAISYTLGGGLGPLGRRFGYAADHVRRIDLITADGEHHQVTPDVDDDLFWGARGGGGNFGVVTELEVSLFPIAELYGGGIFFSGEYAADVLAAFLEVLPTAPEALSLSVAVLTFPSLPALPPPLRGAFVCHVRVAHDGAPEVAEECLRPIRRAAPALLDTVQVMPFSAVGGIHADPTDPHPVSSRSQVLGHTEDAFFRHSWRTSTRRPRT